MTSLEKYFKKFRKEIIGINATYTSPYGEQKLIYADWIASGRLYGPIEQRISNEIGAMVGNTHSESSETGIAMTQAYHLAQKIIKAHVNANDDDVIIMSGHGMTSCINKLQRILGIRVPEQAKKFCQFSETARSKCPDNLKELRPVVFLTHTEHHSNHTSWLETFADVVIIEPNADMTVNPESLRKEIKKYEERSFKIGSFSACSNVTGYMPPYYELAKIMHENGGYCFVDFAASAPYYEINMHPADPLMHLDAIFFSPHKFLGGPGSAGVLIFNKALYKNEVPDNSGGGTVKWTNRWGQYSYITDIEAKEDGGTPGFLQTIRAALCIRLKEQMGTEHIHRREKELLELAFPALLEIKGLHILADNVRERLGIISFYIEGIHHNLLATLLNDRFGIQMRGGCSCAGTYGHYLLNVTVQVSKEITDLIDQGDLSLKPGWVRMSLHPTMTNDELYFILDALSQIVTHIDEWRLDYEYSKCTNEFYHKSHQGEAGEKYQKWFVL